MGHCRVWDIVGPLTSTRLRTVVNDARGKDAKSFGLIDRRSRHIDIPRKNCPDFMMYFSEELLTPRRMRFAGISLLKYGLLRVVPQPTRYPLKQLIYALFSNMSVSWDSVSCVSFQSVICRFGQFAVFRQNRERISRTIKFGVGDRRPTADPLTKVHTPKWSRI